MEDTDGTLLGRMEGLNLSISFDGKKTPRRIHSLVLRDSFESILGILRKNRRNGGCRPSGIRSSEKPPRPFCAVPPWEVDLTRFAQNLNGPLGADKR